ncbi:DNA cytosine methyltransferase [Brooklawnia cerclae]|uniref:DNA (cytosine-5-)-methyltransferase n=1 Tax=Brooklawnia cerclae TaxID=349934 RepID=A0ABX0SHM7_9ACTN|nr:DNA cytosine methyltransferase [Brooklawnia cerclae]NIH56271.1 DNA (cytosine-5)-methyltransferase 1 [Brooklawnia cerclae]
MTLSLTDMFCGAGGSSTGAIEVPGVEVASALNHWKLAIETHNTNHPNARHILADISQIDPRYVPGSDLLWASPECTNHSVAKGRKRATTQAALFGDDKPLPDDAAERSRATMWDVPRFAEHHHYRAIITENVVDAAKWIMFPAWLHAMDLLGYDRRIVWLNSMHAQAHGAPAPQSRDRMYVVFWRRGDRAPDLDRIQRPVAWCPLCGEFVEAMQTFKHPERPWGRYGAQYYYRCPKHSCKGQRVEPGWLPASTIIDQDLPAERIGDRARPLSPKTMARIRAGLERYRSDGLIIEAFGNTYDAANPKHPSYGQPGGYYRVWPDSDPLRTQTGSATKALLIPVEGRAGKRAMSAGEPLRTQTARNETGLLMPMDTIAAAGTHHALAEVGVPAVEDCRFRMLEPPELKRGMAFPDSYAMLGTKREQVRMTGNAVTPPAARDLVWAVAEALGAAA